MVSRKQKLSYSFLTNWRYKCELDMPLYKKVCIKITWMNGKWKVSNNQNTLHCSHKFQYNKIVHLAYRSVFRILSVGALFSLLYHVKSWPSIWTGVTVTETDWLQWLKQNVYSDWNRMFTVTETDCIQWLKQIVYSDWNRLFTVTETECLHD